MATLITTFSWIMQPARQRSSFGYDAEIHPPDNEIGIADDPITALAIFCDQRQLRWLRLRGDHYHLL